MRDFHSLNIFCKLKERSNIWGKDRVAIFISLKIFLFIDGGGDRKEPLSVIFYIMFNRPPNGLLTNK